MRLLCRIFVLLAGLLLLGVAGAAELERDRDYRLITPPLPVDVPAGRVEVIEFFWYGCEHCDDFDPTVSAWSKALPADVVFRRIPALRPGNNRWMPAARLFYALEAMGIQEALHSKVFNAIHREGVRLDDDFILLDWIGRQGVDRQKFREVMLSPAVASRVQLARELTVKAGLSGVPAMVVQGRYVPIKPDTYASLLKTVDQLVVQVRSEAVKK